MQKNTLINCFFLLGASVRELGGLQHLTYKGESRVCSAWRRQREDLYAVFNYLMGSWRADDKDIFFQRYTAKEEEGIDTVCSKGNYSKSKGRNNPLHKDGQSKGKSPSVQWFKISLDKPWPTKCTFEAVLIWNLDQVMSRAAVRQKSPWHYLTMLQP